MNGQLILSYPWYLTALCVLLGLGVATWLYYRDELLAGHRILRGVLFGLRTILVASLAFLILGPLWRGFTTRTEKPIVIYLEDVSNSVAAFTPADDLESFRKQRDDLLRSLEGSFEIERYKFGGSLMAWEDSLDGREKATDLSGSLNRLLEVHSYQNVGAVIVASDGIYNQGYNPTFSNLAAGTSVYTVGLGDSTTSRDLFVQALQYPKVVYLGDQFQLDIEWGALHLKGTAFSLSVKDERGREWLRERIGIDRGEQYGRKSIILDANEPGIRKYTVRLETASQEDISANNVQYAYVEVLDGRKKVLLLYDSPHPDIKAIRTVIDQNRNYEVTALSLRNFQGSLSEYDLVVLHGWPSPVNPAISRRIWTSCLEDGRPVVAILSATSDIREFNARQSVLRIETAGSQLNDVQALLNPGFRDFQWPDNIAATLRNYPPLLTPFGEYTAGPDTRTILYQRLGDINTGYPMVIAGQEGASRVMVIAGEGMWRWRMTEFARNENTAVFDQLTNQMIQYVAIKEDKRKFRLLVQKTLSWENEPVKLNAELYNANFELVNEPEVSLKLRRDGGDAYDFTMDKTLNAYQLDAGLLPVGSYTATATTEWSGTPYTASVRFTVREVQLETLRKQADHAMLYNLSAASGGKLYTVPDMGGLQQELESDINLKPVLYQSEKTTSLLQFQWIFFLLLGMLSIEWVVRKWLGGY